MFRPHRLIVCALALLTILIAGAGVPESLNYKVMYKWGLINKQAGHVNLSTSQGSAGRFNAILTAASEPWADKFYMVRDTLRGIISTTNGEPDFYEKISHEGGSYKRDVIRYTRSGKLITANCDRYEAKKEGNEPVHSFVTHQAEGFYLDMLSAFYYMRSLPFPSMRPDESRTMNIFSGKRIETLTIRYLGREEITIDKQKYTTYHISFRFTGKGGKETSDSMEAWIAADSSRIPLKLEGKLPVGKVVCLYTR